MSRKSEVISSFGSIIEDEESKVSFNYFANNTCYTLFCVSYTACIMYINDLFFNNSLQDTVECRCFSVANL